MEAYGYYIIIHLWMYSQTTFIAYDYIEYDNIQ